MSRFWAWVDSNVPKSVGEVPRETIFVPMSVVDLTKSVVELTKSVVELTKSVADLTKSVADLTKSVVEVPFSVVKNRQFTPRKPGKRLQISQTTRKVPKAISSFIKGGILTRANPHRHLEAASNSKRSGRKGGRKGAGRSIDTTSDGR